MKKSTKKIIAISGLVILGIIAFLFARFIFEGAIAIHETKKQINAAKKYMDSLTDKDIQTWIQRSQKLLKEDNPTDFVARDAPPDLQQFGIEGIEESTDFVDYVWIGGMGDTSLDVEWMSNGNFQVIAVYTPYSNRVIWPRQ